MLVSRDSQEQAHDRLADLNRQVTILRKQRDQLLNLRLLEEIDERTFVAKGTELRDRVSHLTLQIEACDRSQAENGEIAVKAFELSIGRHNS